MNAEQKRLARIIAGVGTHVRVMEVDGDSAPTLKGHAGYWTTPSGKTVVHHPNSYGWRTVYHCTTQRIEVGREWLAREGRHADLRVDDGVTWAVDLRTHVRVGECAMVNRWGSSQWLVARGAGDERRTYHTEVGLSPAQAAAAAHAAWERQDAANASLRDQLARETQGLIRRSLHGLDPRSVSVTMADSSAVGNCVVGAVAFARRSGIDTRRGVTAAMVIRAMDVEPRAIQIRAINAIEYAARRCATTVCI